jgi:diadenosine tetraphosphate (Ap4A) HIT family hydrolase
MDKGDFVNIVSARVEEQREAMGRIRVRGECPFCPENLQKEHKEPIIRMGVYWVLTKNQWPYENTRVHLLAISRTHAERLEDVHPEAGTELFSLCKWIEREYGIESGAIGIRFGNPAGNGGTVRHLHAQILSADITDRNNPEYEPVRFRVG